MKRLKLKAKFKAYLELDRKQPGALPRWELVRWFLPWANSLDEGRSPINDRVAWVTFRARAFLDRLLKPGMRAFEYGMGGSTLYFLRKGCDLCSVENHPDWYKAVEKELEKRPHPPWRGFLREPEPPGLLPAAPDPLEDCRSEFGEFQGRTFREYVRVIDQFPGQHFDLVVIDGRARHSCFAHAHMKVNPGGYLVLDNSERVRYQGVHEGLRRLGWSKRDFFGPGPYVAHEFWNTTVWRRPSLSHSEGERAGMGFV